MCVARQFAFKNVGVCEICARQASEYVVVGNGPNGKCELSLGGIITDRFMRACSLEVDIKI